MTTPPIASTMHDFFRREGYLYMPSLVGAEDCTRVLGEFAATEPEARDAMASHAFWRTDAVHERLPSARHLLRDETLLSLLRSILGPNVALITNRHNHITVNAGMSKAGRLHRDILHWSRNVITLIVYIKVPASLQQDNGTAVLPGSHLLPTTGRANNGGTWLDEGPYAPLARQAVNVAAETGSVLLMDGMTYHSAETRLADSTTEHGQARVALSWACRAIDELDRHDMTGAIELLAGDDLYRGNDRPAATPRYAASARQPIGA